jgi:hypothetical protein
LWCFWHSQSSTASFRQVGGEDDPLLVLGACYSLIYDKDSHVLSLDKLFMFGTGSVLFLVFSGQPRGFYMVQPLSWPVQHLPNPVQLVFIRFIVIMTGSIVSHPAQDISVPVQWYSDQVRAYFDQFINLQYRFSLFYSWFSALLYRFNKFHVWFTVVHFVSRLVYGMLTWFMLICAT